jgi:hypothetical protein
MAHQRMARTTLASTLVALAACGDAREPTHPDTDPSPDSPPQQAQDTSFDSDPLAQAIPGFGGFFIDARGVPTVRLTSLEARATAERVLQPSLRSLDMGPALQVIKADYTAKQLDAWVRLASPEVLALRGVVFVDNNEELNRVTVGVETRAAESAVRAIMTRLGIQREAVIVQQAGPIVEAVTLRDRVRPVVGGLQIFWTRGTSAFVCTLGFNAFNPPSTQRGFITNSHCTRARGNVASPTPYFQAVSPDRIGTEIEDPPFFTSSGCPAGRQCRFSDAARANYNTTTSQLGRIARTTGPGSLTIAGRWTITGEGQPTMGMRLHKVGRTTGWSFGAVTITCANVNVSGSNITMICQDVVRANVAGGDSGSPVFRRNSSTGFNVTLRGILWGETLIGGNVHFVMSRMQMIERELGALTTF